MNKGCLCSSCFLPAFYGLPILFFASKNDLNELSAESCCAFKVVGLYAESHDDYELFNMSSFVC